MSDYIKKFNQHSQYETYIDGHNVIKPNVSYCVEENEVHYNALRVGKNIITYNAPAKLNETTSNATSGLHTNAFSGANGQLSIILHIFENGVGYIKFNGNIRLIGERAFYDCRSITSITIPEEVIYIDHDAFMNCFGLTSVTIPNSVMGIGGNAFLGCLGLESLTIGSGVQEISGNAFQGCRSLSQISTYATTAPNISNNTFQGVANNGLLSTPNGATGYDVWMGTGDYYLGKYGWMTDEAD